MISKMDDYQKGYAEGYNAGFRAGLEAGKTIQPSNPLWNTKPYCRVCGMDFSKPMGYVCYNSNCPTKVTCSSQISYTWGSNTTK